MFDIISKQNSYQSIDECLDSFLRSLDIRQSSKNTYKRQLREFFLWIKSKNIESITREHVLEYKEMLVYKKELAAFTVGGYLTAVRRFFEWLEAVKIYPNIAKAIKGPKRTRGFKKDCLTIEQVKKLLSSIDRSTVIGKRDYAILNLMIRTGLRTIEIARSLREDISNQGGQAVLFIHGKGRDTKDELVVLTESTLNPIIEYFQARKSVKPRDVIFCSHSTKNDGKRLTTRSVSRIVKNSLRNICLDDSRLTAHSLRHTAITFSLLAGASTQEARILARHADINTTLVYAHNINRIQNAPERKIDSFLED